MKSGYQRVTTRHRAEGSGTMTETVDLWEKHVRKYWHPDAVRKVEEYIRREKEKENKERDRREEAEREEAERVER